MSIDQTVIQNHSYPLTQYYFWPRTEAWEQLKLELDSKPWLSEKEKISILNLATDIKLIGAQIEIQNALTLLKISLVRQHL